jgi:hypothetical protein
VTALDTPIDRQEIPVRTFGSLAVGLYAWVAAVSFGAVLLDIVYSRLVAEARTAFAEEADFLLLVSAVTIVAAFGAIVLAWNAKAARNLCIASLVIVVSGLFAPVLLSPYLQGAGSSLGTGIRLAISGLASLLAFLGFYKLRRNE